jgi:hypothetical protein
MLKYMPLYGSILLTAIIVWIVISTIIGNRRKIGAALAGNHYVNLQSLCCAAEITPIVWTADGWVAACRECGAWQYFGDDFNEISENIITSDSRRSPAPRPSAVNGPESLATGLRPNCTCDTVRYINGDHLPDCPTQRIGFMESNPGSEVTSDRYSPAQAEMLRDDYRQAHPEIAALWDTPEGRQAVSNAALSVAIADEGEPLAVPPPPNIGGEGHPPYAGPHYAVEHDRFVPYDVLRDPIPGAAVHIVGNVACVGPLEVEEGPGDDTLDPSREDEDRV